MQAKRGKIDPNKQRCDRCEAVCPPISECQFSFRATYAHWKAIWQKRTGKRLTNLRKQRLADREEEQLDLKTLSGVVYYMDLCERCFRECSQPWESGFPVEFYEGVLIGAVGLPSAENLVPAKTQKAASGVKADGL